MKMFVGNLRSDETERALRSTFELYGAVSRVSIESDRQSGQFRGFGFVEMSSDEDGVRAVDGLNGKERNGRVLTVSCVGPYRSANGGGSTKRGY